MPSRCTDFQCLQTYGCEPLSRVRPGAVFAPYVSIEFTNRGTASPGSPVQVGGTQLTGGQSVSGVSTSEENELTVGNQSSPDRGNHAVIKSFQFGGSSGQGCVVEIFDEEGSEFTEFMNRLNNSIRRTSEDYAMAVDFGWIIRKCDQSITRYVVSNFDDGISGGGGRLHFMPANVEADYSNGKIRFQVTATDLLGRISENRTDMTIGSDSQRVRLMPAVRQMLQRNIPSIERVDFLRQTPNGPTPYNFRNSDGGREGPAATWNASQQNGMAAARQWLNNVTTDRGKGIIGQWNCAASTPHVIFWEDGQPGCNENGPLNSCGPSSFGSYIVNGGDCSPVISFAPKVGWNFSQNQGSGGNFGGGVSSRQVLTRQPICRQALDRAGIQTQPTVGAQVIQWRPPELALQRAQEALGAHQAAGLEYEQWSPVEAELKIQGDPRFVFPALWRDKTVAIIVINPFHIVGGQGTCDWLARPACNSIFSSKRYLIKEVSHEIKEGSYTTTLKVMNRDPNIQRNQSEPFPNAS